MSGTDRSLLSILTETSAPAVILVDPQLGENIGTAARAMLNCGFTDLRLVRPRDGWPSEKALSASAGALESMPPAQVFERLEDALTGCHQVYATTARPRELVKPVFTPRGAAADIRTRQAAGQTIGILFGGERAGLTTDDVARAHGVITIPLHPGFTSLNLAQAVLLVAHAWHEAGDETPDRTVPTGDSTPAPHEETEAFLIRLEEELESGNFFRTPEMKPAMLRNIRSLYLRAEPTDQEIRTLHGMLTALIGKKGSVRK
ncbi:MAG TPA: RNA methyltransferase [Alphaproteobacteria bacterium]|nr:RNA methyltransferase [Alphaproteobacteria bacterium]